MPRGKVNVYALYGSGAAMGFLPEQIDAMDVAEFRAVAAGYIKANSASEKNRLTEGEKDDLFDFILQVPAARKTLSLHTWRFDDDGRFVSGGTVSFEKE